MEPKTAAPRKYPKIPNKQQESAEVFLRMLALTGNVSESAKKAGCGRSKYYHLRSIDPDFAKAWDDAFEQAVDSLEAEARKRALAKSDTLLIFLLKGYRPHIFRDIHQIEGGLAPLKIEVVKFSGNGKDHTDTPQLAPTG